MVGFSDNIDPNEKDPKAFEDAVKACEDAGIMVWFCGEYVPAAFLPMSDKNDFNNVIRDGVYGNAAPKLVYVPAGSRTTATGDGGDYIYWASGGYSWTMPYVLGIYAIVTEIDPSLDQEDLRKMIVETACVKDGMKIIDPVGFVAAALEGVGRTEGCPGCCHPAGRVLPAVRWHPSDGQRTWDTRHGRRCSRCQP